MGTTAGFEKYRRKAKIITHNSITTNMLFNRMSNDMKSVSILKVKIEKKEEEERKRREKERMEREREEKRIRKEKEKRRKKKEERERREKREQEKLERECRRRDMDIDKWINAVKRERRKQFYANPPWKTWKTKHLYKKEIQRMEDSL